jgi:hypothetical protein
MSNSGRVTRARPAEHAPYENKKKCLREGDTFLAENRVIFLPTENPSKLACSFHSLSLGGHLNALGNFPQVAVSGNLEQTLTPLSVEKVAHFLGRSKTMRTNGSKIAILALDRTAIVDNQVTPQRNVANGAGIDAMVAKAKMALGGAVTGILKGRFSVNEFHFNFLLCLLCCIYYIMDWGFCQPPILFF